MPAPPHLTEAGMGGLLETPGAHGFRWGGWRSVCPSRAVVNGVGSSWWPGTGGGNWDQYCLATEERAEYTLCDLLLMHQMSEGLCQAGEMG